jgi:hypothetical protein
VRLEGLDQLKKIVDVGERELMMVEGNLTFHFHKICLFTDLTSYFSGTISNRGIVRHGMMCGRSLEVVTVWRA